MQSAQVLRPIFTKAASSPADQFESSPSFASQGFSMRFERNEEIFGEGEKSEFAYKVISGTARTFRILNDGRRQIVGFHLAGEIFGLERGDSHRFSAEAVCECVVMLVRRVTLEKAARTSGDAACWLWGLASVELERLQDHMTLLGRKTAAERVGAFLLEMAERSPVQGGMELPMSRTDIADYLGLTIETVSRTLTQFERDGAIAMPSCRRIILRDRGALAGDDA